MPESALIPITCPGHQLLSAILGEENESWRSELGWDYEAVSRILLSFIDQKLLPGYAATDGSRVLGYSYFLVHHSKGIIGTVYTSPRGGSRALAEQLLFRTITSLREVPGLRRIESQILPVGPHDLTAAFLGHGFRRFSRYFLKLNLSDFLRSPGLPEIYRLARWDPFDPQPAADVIFRSYKNQIDAVICEDYGSMAGCESYLRSLAENPGCGTLIPEATLVGFDPEGVPRGIVVSSQISPTAAMIPQIAIHPCCQGRGLGNALVYEALAILRNLGYRTVALTVTGENRRAFAWYRRLGFTIFREFGAYTWDRD